MEQSSIDTTEQKKQFFQRIKTETADLHRQTESSPLSMALMSEQVNEKDYSDYLLHMKDIIEYYEGEVFDALSHLIPDIEQRRKLQLIKNDLTSFNIDPSTTTKSFSLPPATSDAQLLGYMYVLEGSALGGAMIDKHISRHLSFPDRKAREFFNCYQAELGSRWKKFLDIMGDHSLPGNNADEIIRGARIAFQKIYEHLTS